MNSQHNELLSTTLQLRKIIQDVLQLCFPGIPKEKSNEFIKRVPKGQTSSK